MKRYLPLILFVASAASAWECQNAVGTFTQRCPLKLVSSTDSKTPKTNATITSCYRSKNGGASAACVGSNPSQIDATNQPGIYWYTPVASDVDTQGTVVFTIKSSDADQQDFTMLVGGVPDGSITPLKFPTMGTIGTVSGTTIQVGTSYVTADDIYNSGYRLVIYDPTTGYHKISSCITDSAKDVSSTTDTVTTAADLSASITANTDKFDIMTDGTCAPLGTDAISAAAVSAAAVTKIQTGISGGGGGQRKE